jgi:3-hydroxybutyryl-CoA dehydrogenase
MSKQHIIVCGAGTMGSGIAQVAAVHGHDTFLYDSAPEALQRARVRIQKTWETLVSKERMRPEDRETAIRHLHFITDPSGMTADLIIEAIVENLDAKTALFKSISGCYGPNTVLASNTSSLSIDAIQEALPNPERVAGMHFFNPAPVMKLVEIVRGRKTSEEVIRQLEALTLSWGKVPVVCKDAPGFIVNRVARAFYLEALQMAEEDAADVGTIDRIAEASGFKMGPFRLMDLIGNDINLAVSQSLYAASGHAPRFKPSPIQEAIVARGDLGRKTGKGYYSYA